MDNFIDHARSSERGLLGTWVKIPSFEVIQLFGRAGFDLVVIDLEHAAIDTYRAVELVFAVQAQGMAAIVRLPDRAALHLVQPLLDGGADGLLVPRIADPSDALAITRR